MTVEPDFTFESSPAERLSEVRELLSDLANQDLPPVWVGEEGMTAEELLALQESNEELPEYMQVQPGELVEVDGFEGGIRMPKPGVPRLHALDVLRYLEEEMQPEVYVDLSRHVGHIQAAKEGRVFVHVADEVEWVPKERLTHDDFSWGLVGIPGRKTPLFYRYDIDVTELPDVVGVCGEERYDTVPIEDLEPEYIDEDFVQGMEVYAEGGFGPYVIPETERVKAYLVLHGEYID